MRLAIAASLVVTALASAGCVVKARPHHHHHHPHRYHAVDLETPTGEPRPAFTPPEAE